MLPVPSGVHVWLAPGRTNMHEGFTGLSSLIQETLTSIHYTNGRHWISTADFGAKVDRFNWP